MQHQIRTFGRRGGRTSTSVKQAKNHYWQAFGLEKASGVLDVATTFVRPAELLLEIGFGTGTSLLELAKHNPQYNFIGIETYRPAIGAMLLALQRENLSNVRLYNDNAIEVLKTCIPDNSLMSVQIFFPDPWPKRRHHHRRLIQPAFTNLLMTKLRVGGELHLATDWEHYAKHMLQVMNGQNGFMNSVGDNLFAERSPYRPLVSKFEQRALKMGHSIWDLCFIKQNEVIHLDKPKSLP